MIDFSVKLWNINRWLRYTGFRLYVVVANGPEDWTRIGIRWYGSPKNGMIHVPDDL